MDGASGRYPDATRWDTPVSLANPGPTSSGLSGVNDDRMDSPAEPAEGGVRVVWAPDVWSFLVAGDDVASGTTPQGYLASV